MSKTIMQQLYDRELKRSKEMEGTIADLRRRLAEAQQWVHDLQSGMYINCVYCGHRYGPKDKVACTMQEALKRHVEQCPKHPMSALKKQLAEKDAQLENTSFLKGFTEHGLVREQKWAESLAAQLEKARDGEQDSDERAAIAEASLIRRTKEIDEARVQLEKAREIIFAFVDSKDPEELRHMKGMIRSMAGPPETVAAIDYCLAVLSEQPEAPKPEAKEGK